MRLLKKYRQARLRLFALELDVVALSALKGYFDAHVAGESLRACASITAWFDCVVPVGVEGGAVEVDGGEFGV